MNRRSKCKLCKSIIEAINDEIRNCACGEIALDGITKKIYCRTGVHHYCEVDDEGNEILENEVENTKVPNKQELIEELDRMIVKIEELPQNAMILPITHYDFAAALILISSIMKNT